MKCVVARVCTDTVCFCNGDSLNVLKAACLSEKGEFLPQIITNLSLCSGKE